MAEHTSFIWQWCGICGSCTCDTEDDIDGSGIDPDDAAGPWSDAVMLYVDPGCPLHGEGNEHEEGLS